MMTSGILTRGDGDRAMLPMEALSSSTEGVIVTRSAGRGLILILNFFLWSSSSSDSSEEKKWGFLVATGGVASRKAKLSYVTYTDGETSLTTLGSALKSQLISKKKNKKLLCLCPTCIFSISKSLCPFLNSLVHL